MNKIFKKIIPRQIISSLKRYKLMLEAFVTKIRLIVLTEPPPIDNKSINKDYVLACNERSYCYLMGTSDKLYFKKIYSTSRLGKAHFKREKLANEKLSSFNWMTPWRDAGSNWFLTDSYPAENLLYHILQCKDELSFEEKKEIASNVLSITLDLYVAGFSHNDIHTLNLFYIDGHLKLTDFEFFIPYYNSWKGSFWNSYDIVGGCPVTLAGEKENQKMGICDKRTYAVLRMLDVSIEEAKADLRLSMEKELFSHTAFSSSSSSERMMNLPLPVTHCELDLTKFNSFLDLSDTTPELIFLAERFPLKRYTKLVPHCAVNHSFKRFSAFLNLENIFIEEYTYQGDINLTSNMQHDIVFAFGSLNKFPDEALFFNNLGRLAKKLAVFDIENYRVTRSFDQKLTEAGFSHIEKLNIRNRILIKAWKPR